MTTRFIGAGELGTHNELSGETTGLGECLETLTLELVIGARTSDRECC